MDKTEYQIESKENGPWRKWFAWYPVILYNDSYWLTTVYRRKVLSVWVSTASKHGTNREYALLRNHATYEYGTIFDIVKGD